MSIGSGQVRPASDPDVDPPYTATQVALSDWPAHVKAAWQTFQSVNKGDMVLWGERSQPLVVQSVTTNSDETKDVEVEGPRGGTYNLRERYDESGHPRFYADDSKAMDLHMVSGDEGEMRPLTESMYESVVSNLKRAAINNYVEMDYESFQAATRDVVSSWVQDVEFQRWSGWPYDWQDDDSEYIFRMVREHSGRLPETPDDETTSPKTQARLILTEEVRARGREMAHEKLIESNDDYRAIVLKLADNAVERDGVKAQMDARQATVSVVEDFIDAHTDPLYRDIIRHAESEPEDFGLYEGLDEQDITREMAFDILDDDVWQRAREIHEERGTHDPTIRGIAFFEYDELVEMLVEDTLREHQINDNRLVHTTAVELVRDFADNVENHEWTYDFGGVDPDTWGAGDVEDIFSSIVMHAEVDPKLFNPFARDKERKMAVQVLSEVVQKRASKALDEGQRRATKPVPADQYLEDNFGDSITFNEIRGDMEITPGQFIGDAMEGLDEDADLAGWTFVDELVEKAGATVPYMSGPWVLVDYGLVMANDKHRRLSWFNRDNGSVLTLSGMTDGTPQNGEYGYDEFHVALVKWSGPDQPTYLVSDANLDYAFSFVREYIDADSSDVNIIETADGKHYIQESIEEDDINTAPFAAGLAPNFNMPGPGFTVPDVLSYGSHAFERVGKWLTDNSRLASAVTTTAVTLSIAEASYMMYRVAPGINVQPDFDKNYGAGVTATYEFGQGSSELDTYNPDDPNRDDVPYTGTLDAKVRITPGAFRFLADAASPEWLYTTGPGSDTVLENIQRRIEEPLRRGTGDYFRGARVAFLAAHIPPSGHGRPATADEYDEPTYDTIAGREVQSEYSDVLSETGSTHPEETVRLLMQRLAIHGYQVATGRSGYYWSGDEDLQNQLGVEPKRDKALKPAEVHELGWSLHRGWFFGPDDKQTTGDVPAVVENIQNVSFDGDQTMSSGPVCTNKAFLKVWNDLPSTPNTTVLSQVWKFYKARAEDEEGMTLLDAYNRYRMGLVYDVMERETISAIGDHLSEANKGAFEMPIRGMFDRPSDREYWWQLQEPELNASEVFDDPDMNDIGPWLIFPPEMDKRPHKRIGHYYHDPDEGYMEWSAEQQKAFNYSNGAHDTDGKSTYRLNTYQDLFNALIRGQQSRIAERVEASRVSNIVLKPEEWEPGDSQESRKWLDSDESDRIRKAAAGTIDWDDLSGTDLSVFGLFLRGIDMETAANLTDRWNLTDRFETRLSDVLPNSFTPSRPDVPPFDEWRATRRGRNAIGSASDKARAKATYLREIAGFDGTGIETRDALGVSKGVEDDIERTREAREHLEDTDYSNFENFYGEEFGEAFDDVAHKFNEDVPQQDSENQPTIDAARTEPEKEQGPNRDTDGDYGPEDE